MFSKFEHIWQQETGAKHDSIFIFIQLDYYVFLYYCVDKAVDKYSMCQTKITWVYGGRRLFLQLAVIHDKDSKYTEHNLTKLYIPLIFQILIEPSLDAVIICSELGVKHNQVTALCKTTR